MPASYPASVKTFTSRNAGDVINASHVNDLQDEINAVEAGLLNGTAPLNSSASTVASLVVTGLASLSVPTARVSHSAVQQIPINAWTGLDWNTEIYDSTNMHSTATNSSRMTFVGTTGIYAVGAVVEWSTTPTLNMRAARIYVNDSSSALRQSQLGSTFSQTAYPHALALSCDLRVASTTDYVTVQVYQDASTGSIVAESTLVSLGFWTHRVSLS